jgi:chromosome segregation ATPase
LEKLLSVFEQRYFVDDGTIVKQYKYESDIEELKLITKILHYVGTDPSERKKIADEEEAWRTIGAYMQDLRRKAARLEKELEKNAKVLQDTQKELEEKDRVLEENAKVLEENAKVLQDAQKELEEKDRVLREKEEQNARLLKQLEELQKGAKK